MSTSSGGNFTLGTIFSSLMPNMMRKEKALQAEVKAKGDDPEISAPDLIMLQSKLHEWTLLANLNSNIIKELGDTLKGIVQKAA